ncbi:hypothetical protein OJAV_G00187500 [Oryzias javanicus]|uniref:Uncharacterized protein n=1 Tax=Oryzias javanicus TaxID=123683 RepID=A0A3S2MHB2_ORYJA|nr:hypothetical protein OJAV_G00187500 [Oryzias javanicus]
MSRERRSSNEGPTGEVLRRDRTRCLSSTTQPRKMDSQIAKVNKDLTTARDMRKTTQMLMQPNANWEEYLAPAPLSIAIMGELVFISSGEDFSINKNPPKDGFKYIRNSGSFRACLMQVCNLGWHAFNIAHKNMDQIRLHTASVPDHMKETVKILFQGDDKIIETLLPNQLERIHAIANECVELADGVEKKYHDVICLIQEMLEACINAKHIYGEDLEKVQKKIKENEIRKKRKINLEENYAKAMKAMEKQVEEAQEEYKTSMNSLPTGMEMVAMDLAESLSKSLITMGNAVAVMVTQSSALQSVTMTGILGQPEAADQKTKTEEEDRVSDLAIYGISSQIFDQTMEILKFIGEEEINWKELYDQKKKEPKTKFNEDQFKRISGEAEKAEKSKAKDKALSLCKSGIAVCEQIGTYSPDKEWDDKTTKKLIEDVKKLHQDTLQFDSKCKKKSGVPAILPKPPMMSKTEGSTGQSSASQRAAEMAKYRIEQSREQLKQCREEYNKAVDRMEQNKEELTDILVEMQNCNIKEIEFDTTIKMMVKGMDAMGRVKEQWEKMVRFFQMVANIVKISLGKTMNHFAQGVEDAQKLSYNSRLFTKDLLYNQAFQASNIASLVHMISGTYCEVSNKYLMDRISSLGRLMTMDKDKPEFKQERQKLQDSCKEAQESILKLVLNNKKEFEKTTETRMAQIEDGLKAVLPATDPEETKRIKEIVQAGMTDDDIDEYC